MKLQGFLFPQAASDLLKIPQIFKHIFKHRDTLKHIFKHKKAGQFEAKLPYFTTL
nr:MAG TPA: hypothetical protein [Caudoviricetes sp.]